MSARKRTADSLPVNYHCSIVRYIYDAHLIFRLDHDRADRVLSVRSAIHDIPTLRFMRCEGCCCLQ